MRRNAQTIPYKVGENMDVFKIYSKVLTEEVVPSTYFNKILKSKCYPEGMKIKWLYELECVPQNKKFHPEGTVWNHVMMVVDEAAKRRKYSEEPLPFMWGALLHDIGKLTTTKQRKGRWTSYNHDVEGEKLAREILSELTKDQLFIDKVCAYVRWHMQPLFVKNNLPFKEIKKMVEDISPVEVAILSMSDRLGRGEMNESNREEEVKGVAAFLESCGADIIGGEEIKEIMDKIKG